MDDALSNFGLPRTVIITLGALLVALISFWAQGDVGVSLADPGFLWYGTQRVMLGDVPTRDFMSYEPGRYYASAAISNVGGLDALSGSRLTLAIFHAAALAAVLIVLAQALPPELRGRTTFLALAALTFFLWMFPRHKLFDIATSIFLLSALTWMIASPTIRRCFFAGVVVGLAAVMGRNHGVYGLMGSVGVFFWMVLSARPSDMVFNRILPWGLGIVVGFSPVLAMLVIVPGFFTAFLDNVVFVLEAGKTNLPLPVPWPWVVPFAELDFFNATKDVIKGLLFVLVLAIGFLGPIFLCVRQTAGHAMPPALVAGVFLALPYAHFAFSRADTPHLAQAIFPTLVVALVCLSYARSRWRAVGAWTLFLTSLVIVVSQQPGYPCRQPSKCERVVIAEREYLVPKHQVEPITVLRNLQTIYGTDQKPVLAVPLMPGAYALLEQRSPVWEIYPLFPRSEAFERAEIERIKSANPSFVLLQNMEFDQIEDLRFQTTHPVIFDHIQENFVLVEDAAGQGYLVFVSKDQVR